MQQDAQEFMAFLLDGLHEVGIRFCPEHMFSKINVELVNNSMQ